MDTEAEKRLRFFVTHIHFSAGAYFILGILIAVVLMVPEVLAALIGREITSIILTMLLGWVLFRAVLHLPILPIKHNSQ